MKDFTKAHRDIMGKGVTWREFLRYKEILEQIGAVSFEPGKKGMGKWPKRRIVDDVTNRGV